MKASALNPLAHCAVIIGIDPGVNTGVAVGSCEDPALPITWDTMDFWSAYDFVTAYEKDCTGIVIETPARFMYRRNDKDFGERVKMNMSSKMGGNRREAELLADRFEDLGFPVERVTPTKTKWNAKDLARYTGITQRTNEHTRDAIRLVFERVK